MYDGNFSNFNSYLACHESLKVDGEKLSGCCTTSLKWRRDSGQIVGNCEKNTFDCMSEEFGEYYFSS